MDLPPFLVGPTGIGKTAIGVRLARALGADVLSVDSRQAYRGLDIATAKPTPAEGRAAPHHLLDLFEPTEVASAADFARRFRAALAGIHGRGRRALAVGGSGLYVDACLGRLDRLPPADLAIRAEHDRILATDGPARLHALLRDVDPETAARLAPGDGQRISRALEVYRLTGAPLSRLHTRRGALDVREGPPLIVLVRERRDLRERIAARAQAMLAAGLLDELAAVLAAGVPADAPGLQAIGCGDFIPLLRGEVSREAALEAFIRRTRQYAKRQVTWFRNRYRGARPLELAPDEAPETSAERVRELLESPLTAPPAGA
jgi:tRNA dimethylallyltransferase